MNLPPSSDDTRKLHGQYTALTGLEIPYSMQIHFMLEAWLAAGFTEPDLACVVRHIKQKIKEGKRPKESLLPRNLFQRTDFFAEDLAISRAEARNTTKPTPRQEALRSIGRSEPVKEAKSAESILESERAFQAFKEWRKVNQL